MKLLARILFRLLRRGDNSVKNYDPVFRIKSYKKIKIKYYKYEKQCLQLLITMFVKKLKRLLKLIKNS